MSGSKVKESELEDRTLMCKDCGNKFIWTAGEQKFFLDKGLQNIPKRCKPCTAFYKTKLREKKPMFWIQCANCRIKSEVPFEVQTDDVLCEKCFNKKIEERNEVIKSIGETIPE
jgi:CxxC-x17-CxxC domain-containing protein